MQFQTLFPHQKPLIGMVHLLPLPETPAYNNNIEAIIDFALADADALVEAGVDAFIIENFGDEPYLIGEPTPLQFAVMTHITSQIRSRYDIPLGINVQFNAWKAEIAIAHACQAQFIRVEVFVDTVISAQGTVHPCSAQLTRYRKTLGAGGVQIFADIQTKYTQNMLPQSLAQSAIDAVNAGADALIVTGGATGEETPLNAVQDVKEIVDLPILVGSGTNHNNIREVFDIADGAIVGSSLKQDGIVTNPVSTERTKQLVIDSRTQG